MDGGRSAGVFRTLRKNGTVVLPALAWGFVTAAHLGLASPRSLLVSHVVMDVVFVLFLAASWAEMQSGIMRAWRNVILVGLLVTAAATVTLASPMPNPTVLAVTVSTWMVVPAVALLYTGRGVTEAAWVYLGGGALSLLGWVAYLAWLLAGAPTLVVGLALVGVGQTAGIVDAVYRY